MRGKEAIIMRRLAKKTRETLTEAYEVRAFRDESEASGKIEAALPEIPHAEPGEFQAIKNAAKGHGEQTILPDDCEFGDNDMCDVET
jgi:hypothetical protein